MHSVGRFYVGKSTQIHKEYAEGDDVYKLHLYLCNKKRPVILKGESALEMFAFALEFKKRVPHLLYGPGKKYEKLFARDPAQLMAFAKSEITK